VCCVSNRDTDPPIQKLLHTVGMLCIHYYHYEACQRKNRANSWSDCHSRVEVSRQQAQKKKSVGISRTRFSNWQFGSRPQAGGGGGPRYGGGQQSGVGIKKAAVLAYDLRHQKKEPPHLVLILIPGAP
jgi:hypothetical protein